MARTPKSSELVLDTDFALDTNLNIDEPKSNYLSPTFEASGSSSTRPRSSSADSFVSGTTQVTDVQHDSDFAVPEKETKFKTIAGDVEFSLTFGEHLKLLCSFGKKKRMIKRRVKVTNVDESDEEDREPSDYIKSIYVLSREKDESGHFIQKEAQCMIDSGCHQGNFVSRTFLVEQLGIREAEFSNKPFKKHELVGHVMTGHLLEPEGVIHLDWYHVSSKKVYRQMRFLVSSTQPCDIVVGARSIKKHRILAPPNLVNIVDLNGDDNIKIQKLEAQVENIRNEIGSCEEEIKAATRAKDNSRLQKAQGELSNAKNVQLPAAEQSLTDYIAKVEADKAKAAQKKSKPAKKSTENNKIQSKSGPIQPHIPNPSVMITDFGGITRSVTGYSFTTSRLTRLHKK